MKTFLLWAQPVTTTRHEAGKLEVRVLPNREMIEMARAAADCNYGTAAQVRFKRPRKRPPKMSWRKKADRSAIRRGCVAHCATD